MTRKGSEVRVLYGPPIGTGMSGTLALRARIGGALMSEGSGYQDRHERAADTFSVFVPGVEPERVAASLAQRLGALGSFAFDAFGEVWARPVLARRDRSLVVIAILVALGADRELAVHVPAGVRHGLSQDEIEAAITHLALYSGFPRAVEAMRAARDALAAPVD